LEFKQEFGLKEEELAAGIRRDIMTSGKSSLSALIEQWKDLADAATEEDIAERNNLANQIKVLVEEQKFLRDELRGSLNADSSPNTGAAFLTPQGSSGGFNLIGTRPGQ
jgi:alanyl-tRNA synthetase